MIRHQKCVVKRKKRFDRVGECRGARSRVGNQRDATNKNDNLGQHRRHEIQPCNGKRRGEGRMRMNDGLDIRPLDPDARERFRERWQEVQGSFADEPERGVEEADALVADILRERGYPDDFEQHAAVISVEHPETIEHLRATHAIRLASAANGAREENLREAMDHFRALIDDLLEET